MWQNIINCLYAQHLRPGTGSPYHVNSTHQKTHLRNDTRTKTVPWSAAAVSGPIDSAANDVMVVVSDTLPRGLLAVVKIYYTILWTFALLRLRGTSQQRAAAVTAFPWADFWTSADYLSVCNFFPDYPALLFLNVVLRYCTIFWSNQFFSLFLLKILIVMIHKLRKVNLTF